VGIGCVGPATIAGGGSEVRMMRVKVEASEPWETEYGWEEVVCESVKDYPMAPRWAREILEVAGQLFDQGIEKDLIVRAMTGRVVFREYVILKLASMAEPEKKRFLASAASKKRKMAGDGNDE